MLTIISAPARNRLPTSPGTASPRCCARQSTRSCSSAPTRWRGGRRSGASLAAKAALELGAVKDGWNGFSVLHHAASRVGALDIGFVPGEGGLTARQMTTSRPLDVLFLLGADEIEIAPGAFVVYIGTHGDRGAHAPMWSCRARPIPKNRRPMSIPKAGCRWRRAPFPPGDAREDWAIMRALSDVLGKKLPYNLLAALRQALFKAYPHLMRLGQIEPGNAADCTARRARRHADKAPFRSSLDRFLFHQSDRALLRGDGGMLGDLAGRAAMTAAE